MKLNDQQIGLITGAVDDLFYNFKARLLGRFFKGPFMYFEVANENDPKTSIEGLFRYTIHMLYGSQVSVDENQIKKLAEITSNYIDAQRLKTLNRVLTDAERAKTQKELNDLVSEQMDKATSYMNLLSNTETTMVRAYAEREGITQLAAQIGVEDPVVCKRGIVDAKTCDNCLKLWHHPDNPFIPKVYRLSELTDGYNTDHRDPKPTVGHTHPHCYDDQTEVLTSNGWKLFKDVTGSDLFLSVDPKTGNSEWVNAVAKVESKYIGNMLHITNRGVDLMTTMNHSHFIKTLKYDGIREVNSQWLLDHTQFQTIHCVPNWVGDDSEYIDINGKKFETDVLLEFLGYWLAEGCLSYGSADTVRVEISQEKHIDKMKTCMDRLFQSDVYSKHGKLIKYLPKDHSLVKLLSQQGKSWEKFVPDLVKLRSKKQIRIFLDAYCLGDGSRRQGKEFKGYTTKPEIVYFTSSPQMASDIGELILKVGHRPSYTPPSEGKPIKFKNGTYTPKHICWLIRERVNGYSHSTKLDKKLVPYAGMIYDVTLEKFHTLFVRRNGKVALSGNCRHVLSFIPPNYGFSKDGSLEFKGFGYDEFAAQREGVKKSENDICRSEIILKLRDGKGSDCPGCKAGLCHL